MVQKSRSKPARKAAAKKAATRGATPAKPKAAKAKPKAIPAKAKAGARKSAPQKTASRRPAARKATAGEATRRKAAPQKGATAKAVARGGKPTKPKNIFRRKSAAAKPPAHETAAAAAPDRDPITLNAPLIDALDEALAAGPPKPTGADQPEHAERRAGMSDYLAPGQGRPPARRPGPGDASPDPAADAPARTNKLVPTNAVHTTKRRMKRNTWQGPTFGLAAVAAIMAILVLGHDREPPEVSPLEQRAETPARGTLPTRMPPAVDPVQAAPDRAPRMPVQAARPAVPTWRGDAPGLGGSQEQDPMRGLKVLELVELERMLKRLDMGPSQPDGIVDRQTESAIRMYQQIAGLPIDGQPSAELLDDMREVVKMLDGDN